MSDHKIVRPLILGAAILAMGAGVMFRRAPDTHSGIPSSEVAALLGGLSAGNRLEDWTVYQISSTSDGRINIELERGASAFIVQVGALDEDKRPVTQTQRYALYYVQARGEPLPSRQEMARITETVGERIRQHELSAPAPS